MSSSEYSEYQESTTVTLDWTVKGLKQLFDSSKGETKSKVTKSVKFGGGRWQILFYPNSGLGTDGGGYLSIYLSCEPTQEEKDAAVNGRWVREGRFKFTFELRNLSKTVHFITKEANDHSFTWKTANWGWAQFARRDAVYYNPNSVRSQDAFIITCTIHSSPSTPIPPPDVPRQTVPRELLDAVGSLLDDPVYSDVEFILPRSRVVLEGGVSKRKSRGKRSIFAARKLLMRAEYFASMFTSGFSECNSENYDLLIGTPQNESKKDLPCVHDDEAEMSGIVDFEDSDIEDEDMELDIDDHDKGATDSLVENHDSDMVTSEHDDTDNAKTDSAKSLSSSGEQVNDNEEQIVHVSRPSSPPQENSLSSKGSQENPTTPETNPTQDNETNPTPGPRKVKVVVRDVAYATYRAVLYYLYTNSILFAPLSSSFIASHNSPNRTLASAGGSNPALRASQGEGPVTPSSVNQPAFSQSTTARTGGSGEGNNNSGPATRRAWIQDWTNQNPQRIPPCSAKAVYRLADKLNLVDLKSRAFNHIVKSLTIENAPYEMFTSFSGTFEDIRKVQIAFFLENWGEIRTSDAMKTIWQQIRVGRHPGFEEVWPLIAMNLEFKPQNSLTTSGDRDKCERET